MLLKYNKLNKRTNLGLIELDKVMKLSYILWITLVMCGHLSLASNTLAESGPMTIESIKCEGNARASCDFIIEKSTLNLGEEIRDEKMHDIKMRMELLGYFEEIDIRLSKGSSQGKAAVTLFVKEHSSITSNITTGLINLTHPGGVADAAIIDRDLTGVGDSLEFRARWNKDQVPGDDNKRSLDMTSYRLRLEYNRNFVGSKYFMKSGLNYANSNWTFDSVSQNKESTGWIDLAIGRRIFTSSFVILGSRNYFAYSREAANPEWNRTLSPGLLNHIGPYVQYGWDTQDDPNFATRGVKFLVSLDVLPFRGSVTNYTIWSHLTNISIGYRENWEIAPSHVMSFNVGTITQNNDITFPLIEQSAIGLRYSKQFKRHASGSTIQNGAYYVEPGIYFVSTSLDSSNFRERFGAKAGATLQTSFGIVNLFFLGTE